MCGCGLLLSCASDYEHQMDCVFWAKLFIAIAVKTCTTSSLLKSFITYYIWSWNVFALLWLSACKKYFSLVELKHVLEMQQLETTELQGLKLQHDHKINDLEKTQSLILQVSSANKPHSNPALASCGNAAFRDHVVHTCTDKHRCREASAFARVRLCTDIDLYSRLYIAPVASWVWESTGIFYAQTGP